MTSGLRGMCSTTVAQSNNHECIKRLEKNLGLPRMAFAADWADGLLGHHRIKKIFFLEAQKCREIRKLF